MKIIKLVAGLIVICLKFTVNAHTVSLMNENTIGKTKSLLRERKPTFKNHRYINQALETHNIRGITSRSKDKGKSNSKPKPKQQPKPEYTTTKQYGMTSPQK